jgi:hypothetical protein
MILATAAWVLVLPIAGLMALTSPMIFDAGESRALWIMFGFMLAFPVLVIVSPIAAWLFRNAGRRRLAWGLMALPLVWIGTGFAIYFAMGGQ